MPPDAIDQLERRQAAGAETRVRDVEALNAQFGDRFPDRLLEDAAAGRFGEAPAMVSSFGADSAVLLHMLGHVAPDMPVLFVDTEMLFPETLAYQLALAEKLGLRNMIRVRPDETELRAEDPSGELNAHDADACCDLRKVRPLARALAAFDVVITGRKRHQATTRAELSVFERDGARLRINPLAGWAREDIRQWMDEHDLPRHPLVAQGYPSIGCAPCTTPVAAGEDPRAGRWRGADKTECGIHFIGGKLVRTGGADTAR